MVRVALSLRRRWDFVFVQNGHVCTEHLARWGRRRELLEDTAPQRLSTRFTESLLIRGFYYDQRFILLNHSRQWQLLPLLWKLQLHGRFGTVGKDQLVVGSQPLLPAEWWRGSGTVVSIAGKACLRQGYFSTASTDALSSLRDLSDLLESCSAALDRDNELCVGGNCSRSLRYFFFLKCLDILANRCNNCATEVLYYFSSLFQTFHLLHVFNLSTGSFQRHQVYYFQVSPMLESPMNRVWSTAVLLVLSNLEFSNFNSQFLGMYLT